MSYRYTSLIAYTNEKNKKRRETQKDKIINAIAENGPMTHHELSAATKIPIASVTARVADLQADHKLTKIGEDVIGNHTKWGLGEPGPDNRFGCIFPRSVWAMIYSSSKDNPNLDDARKKILTKLRGGE